MSHRWPPSVTGRGVEEVQRIRKRASVGQPVGPVRARVPKATIAVTDSAHRPLDKGTERRVCAHGCWFCAGVDLGGVVGEGVACGRFLGRGGECVQGCARRCGQSGGGLPPPDDCEQPVLVRSPHGRPGMHQYGKPFGASGRPRPHTRRADIASLRHAGRGTRLPDDCGGWHGLSGLWRSSRGGLLIARLDSEPSSRGTQGGKSKAALLAQSGE